MAEKIDVPFHEVDAHNVVPVWEASDKRETGARTIRNKINRQLGKYLEVIFTPLIRIVSDPSQCCLIL